LIIFLLGSSEYGNPWQSFGSKPAETTAEITPRTLQGSPLEHSSKWGYQTRPTCPQSPSYPIESLPTSPKDATDTSLPKLPGGLSGVTVGPSIFREPEQTTIWQLRGVRGPGCTIEEARRKRIIFLACSLGLKDFDPNTKGGVQLGRSHRIIITSSSTITNVCVQLGSSIWYLGDPYLFYDESDILEMRDELGERELYPLGYINNSLLLMGCGGFYWEEEGGQVSLLGHTWKGVLLHFYPQ